MAGQRPQHAVSGARRRDGRTAARPRTRPNTSGPPGTTGSEGGRPPARPPGIRIQRASSWLPQVLPGARGPGGIAGETCRVSFSGKGACAPSAWGKRSRRRRGCDTPIWKPRTLSCRPDLILKQACFLLALATEMIKSGALGVEPLGCDHTVGLLLFGGGRGLGFQCKNCKSKRRVTFQFF